MRKVENHFYRYDAVKKYQKYKLNEIITVQSPYHLITLMTARARKDLASFLAMDILNTSVAIKTSVSNICATTNFVRTRLFLFYRFLSNGIVLLPASSEDADRAFIHSVCDDVHKEHLFKQPPTQCGGLNYSRRGVYENTEIVHLDFRSFYPSILAAFDISFNNVQIMVGDDLRFLLQSGIYSTSMYREFIDANVSIFKFDGSFTKISEVDSIVNSDFYILMYGNLGAIFNSETYTVGKICAEYLEQNAARSSKGKRVFDKKFINSMCGYFGNGHFTYASSTIYNVMAYLGRRIVSFVANIVDNILISKDTIASGDDGSLHGLNFFTHESYTVCDRVIYIDTDGLFILANESDGLLICNVVNRLFEMCTKTAYINLTHKVTTDFFIACGKKNYHYMCRQEQMLKGTPSKLSTIQKDLIANIKNHSHPIDLSTFDHMHCPQIISILAAYYTSRAKAQRLTQLSSAGGPSVEDTLPKRISALCSNISRAGLCERNCIELFALLDESEISAIAKRKVPNNIREDLRCLIVRFLNFNAK